MTTYYTDEELQFARECLCQASAAVPIGTWQVAGCTTCDELGEVDGYSLRWSWGGSLCCTIEIVPADDDEMERTLITAWQLPGDWPAHSTAQHEIARSCPVLHNTLNDLADRLRNIAQTIRRTMIEGSK